MSFWNRLFPNPVTEIKQAWGETGDSVTNVKGKDRHKERLQRVRKTVDPMSFCAWKRLHEPSP